MTTTTDTYAGRKSPERRAYDTDLSDEQWTLIAPMIPEAERGGRPRRAATRKLGNAILYLLRAGAAWRLLPHDRLNLPSTPPGRTTLPWPTPGYAFVEPQGRL